MPASSTTRRKVIDTVAKKLSKRDLDYFRKLLEERRRMATGDLDSVSESSSREEVGAASGDSADRGSDAADQLTMLTLIQSGTNVVREIDEALERIEDGTYGLCADSGERIERERLVAIPWTRLSIEAQRAQERGF